MQKTPRDEPFDPPYPTPLKKSDKRSWLNLYKRGRKSWIHTMYEGSYRNKLSVVKLPGFKLFMPKRPEDVSSVLGSDYKGFPKSDLVHNALKPLLGESIFTTNGEVWERQRRMMDPAFANAGLKKVFPLMLDAVRDQLTRLRNHPEAEEIRMDEEMTHVTADIIMRTILSKPIKDREALEVFHWFEDFQEKASRVNVLSAFKLPSWIVPWDYILWKKRGRQIREVLGEIIRERYKEFVAMEGETEYGDILEVLMGVEDEVTKTKFSEVELIDQVVMLFLAGHETSASALSWAFYILAHQPKQAELLAAESVNTFDSLETVSFTQVHKLKRARDVFRETLRLYPPVAFFARVSSGENKLGEREAPKGSAVMVSPWMVHRHRELWNEPDTFKPERFAEGEAKKCPGAYFPFSSGPRVCIGAAFAQQEALLIISSIIRDFEFSPSDSHQPDPASRITLRSLNGILLKIKKRAVVAEEKLEDQQQGSVEAVGKCPFS